ncbi:MAG TPA: hypothetical protein DCF33_17295 [Saprospirales bacterium]|nr:hypothetical protein [Saprospirales bacterium]
MKQIFFCLLATVAILEVAHAQNTPLQVFFQSHKQAPGFTHAYLSKELFDVASKHEISKEDWQGLHHVVQNLGVMEILVADSISNGHELYKEAKKCVPTDEFEELLTVRDEQTNVRIWVKAEEAVISDLVLLVGAPQEFVLICFAGTLQLGNLSELPALFESGKTSQLAKISATVSAEFSISPNPASNQITVQLQDAQDVPDRIEILDTQGRQVLSQNLDPLTVQSVNIGSLNQGIYWAQLRTTTGKIGIKQIQVIKH